jgi:ABC-type nitrate/sulfonate/bicarbonate transport system substrate-binding protein
MNAAFRPLLKFAAAVLALIAVGAQAAGPAEVRLGYSDDAPASVVLRKLGWAEQEFARDAVSVQWVKADSSAALRQIAGKTLDLAPAGDTESLIARAAGGQIKSVYVLSRKDANDAARYAFLNTSEQFLAAHRIEAERVIAVYERARQWIQANPEEAARIVAEGAGKPLAQARQQLAAGDFPVSRPGPAQALALKAVAPSLVQQGRIQPGIDTARVVDELIDDRVLRSAMRRIEQQFAGTGQGELALGW